MDKQAIRKQTIEKRSMLGKEYRKKASLDICRKITELVSKDKKVFIYLPMEEEVDTTQLHEFYTQVCVPKCVDSTTMVAVCDFTAFKKTAFGYLEPIDGRIITDIDVAIVPGVAFTEDMDRIGYGGGFYDRFFQKNPKVQKIAVCFDCQLRNDFVGEKHDIKMDCIVTEKRLVFGDEKCV